MALLHITSHPEDFYGNIGDTAQFSIEAEGENLTYKWQSRVSGGTWSNSGLTGNATPTLTVPIVSARLGGQYRCVVTSGSDSVTSDAASLHESRPISKVVYKDRTLIDLTEDTVTAGKLYKGETAHGANGTIITGTAEVTVSGETLNMPDGLITIPT